MLRDFMTYAATDPKIASTVAGVTTATGVGTVLDWIPNDIGKIATCLGIILSIILIYTHLTRGRAEHKKIQLEIELLKKEIEAKGTPQVPSKIKRPYRNGESK